ncbi:hypothetical protein ACO0KY_19650 [Undibacterium sp. Dicai25W]|uniref:hypothetical protein n=1 Tax=Undibacterium sp. Dicai25W TaxID=3413034 RepID=UPI003BF386BC
MAFLDDAKSVLSADDYAVLEKLAKKVSEFDTNSDEDKQFLDLKQSVKKALAERDRAKNLAFLKDGGYSIAEILKAMGITREQLNDAKAELFPNKTEISETIATYTINGTQYEFKMGGRMDKVLSDAIKKGKEKHFIANLTEFGKTWIKEFNIPTQGPYQGQEIYKSINEVVARIKTFSKDALKKELGIVVVK